MAVEQLLLIKRLWREGNAQNRLGILKRRLCGVALAYTRMNESRVVVYEHYHRIS